MLIKYSSNNSGGSWWLTDENWTALENAGWKVEWIANKDYGDSPIGNMMRRMTKEDGRWLGALAKEASKEFETPGEAMKEFEKITGQQVSDEGCNCCGAPHSFSWGGRNDDGNDTGIEWGYASGENCLPHMFGEDGPTSLRDAYERLKGD